MGWTLDGGTILGDSRAGRALHLDAGRIAGSAVPDARRFDASGLLVAPGICDVHGDGFERNLSPRPGVFFPPDIALIETDRQLVANGITTAWLALTVSWEPGLRSLAMAREVIDALARLRPSLGCDIRIQLRWEVYAHDAVPAVEEWLAMTPPPVLAFNDHLSALSNSIKLAAKLDRLAGRAGMSPDAYRDLIGQVAERAPEVPAMTARLARRAAELGVVCFAHDETDAAARAANRAAGITVSEFPLSLSAASAAVEAGEQTVLGAPNVLRGGSHIGAVDAAPAIAAGFCSVLASDYFYPAQLQAVARLAADGVCSLVEAWPLISANAARAAGAEDRGTLLPGQRGDVVMLAQKQDALSVEAVFAAGRPVMVRDAQRIVPV